MDERGSRHLSPDSVEEYFRAGIPMAFSLNKKLEARLEIEPDREQMRLVCPALGSDPDLTSYERISFERINILGEGGDWFRLSVDASRMHYEAYVLIESIVDQLGTGVSFRHAVSESLSSLKDLLSSRKRLTDEKEAGLIGELLVLRHAVARLGEDGALRAWLGPLSEEHDFGFEDFDAEVKTTRSEGRTHQIGSDTQLEPVPGRPLYLVSVQITRAGAAVNGFTLTELIGMTRKMLDRSLRTFDGHLEKIGWRDRDADLYKVRFQERSAPRAYLINDGFPAITAERLDVVIPQRALVTGVSYRVDATHLPFRVPPAPLNDYCEENA